MSGHKVDPSITQPDQPEIYIEDPESACLTAAHKLDAALIFLRGLEEEIDAATPGTDDGGYGVVEVRSMLRRIRDDLRRSVAKSEAKREGAR